MLSETKRQVINLYNCCIWLVNLFELYDDAQTCQRQMHNVYSFYAFIVFLLQFLVLHPPLSRGTFGALCLKPYDVM